VAADNQSKTYDGKLFTAFTAHLTGFANGENATSAGVTGAAGFTGSAVTAVGAGSYTIAPTAASLAAANYDFTSFINATLAISKAHLTVAADNQSKTYDGKLFTAFTAHLTGFANGENATSAGVMGAAGFTGSAVTAVGAGSYTITPTAASLAAANYDFTSFTNGALTINKAPLTVTADSKSKVYGAPLPTLTASYNGFVNGDTPSSLATPVTLTTAATAASDVGSYPISASNAAANNYAIGFVSGTLTVAQAQTSTTATASPNPAVLGQTVTVTAAVAPVAPGAGTPSGTVDFLDTTTGVDLGKIALSGGGASISSSTLTLGSHSITLSYSGSLDFAASPAAITVVVSPNVASSIYVLDPTACGAMSLSGTATINIPGRIEVESKSATALSASGSANVQALAVDVVGGVRATGHVSISPKPATGAKPVADPLAALPAPVFGATHQSVCLAKGSLTINPGVYSQIQVSGNGKLTLNPGIYIIAGGGLAVSGSASIAGNSVLIYNASSQSGGNYGPKGAIQISGQAHVNLTPAAAGLYAGVTIFQARNNTAQISLTGHAVVSTHGVIYAPAARLFIDGGAQLSAPLVVDQFQLSGSESIATGVGPAASSPVTTAPLPGASPTTKANVATSVPKVSSAQSSLTPASKNGSAAVLIAAAADQVHAAVHPASPPADTPIAVLALARTVARAGKPAVRVADAHAVALRSLVGIAISNRRA
jgi:hypothetical protein